MVAVDEIVDFLRAHHEGGDNLAPVEFLVVTRDDAFLHQRQDTVAEHLSMDADVFVVVEARKNGVRYAANAHLQAGTVFNEFGTVASDGFLHFIGFRHVDGE